MAAPNIVNVSTIYGKTRGFAVGTGMSDTVKNPASSGKVYKVNAILAANVNGTVTQDLSLGVYDSDQNVTFRLVYTLAIPADATLDVLSKSIYLEEGDSIQAQAGAAGDLELVISWEEIS